MKMSGNTKETRSRRSRTRDEEQWDRDKEIGNKPCLLLFMMRELKEQRRQGGRAGRGGREGGRKEGRG